MPTMGERIKLLREKNGLTQREIAEAMNYKTTRSVQRVEADEARLDNEQIIFLAVLFDVTSDYLLGLSDDSTPQNRDILNAFPSRTIRISDISELL